MDNKLSLILTACLLPSGEKDNAVEVAELDGTMERCILEVPVTGCNQ